jgi:hypothetical protein
VFDLSIVRARPIYKKWARHGWKLYASTTQGANCYTNQEKVS